MPPCDPSSSSSSSPASFSLHRRVHLIFKYSQTCNPLKQQQSHLAKPLAYMGLTCGGCRGLLYGKLMYNTWIMMTAFVQQSPEFDTLPSEDERKHHIMSLIISECAPRVNRHGFAQQMNMLASTLCSEELLFLSLRWRRGGRGTRWLFHVWL